MNTTIMNAHAIGQSLKLNKEESEAFLQGFLSELSDNQTAIQRHWQAFSQAKQENERQSALVKLELAAHKLKGTTCYGHVPTLNQHCTQFGLVLRQQVDDSQPDLATLQPLYQQVMNDIIAVLTQFPDSDDNTKCDVTFNDFLTQWDNDYRAKMIKLSLFNPSHTEKWASVHKRLFCYTFYHIRGHFYKFLWLLGNMAPDKSAKDQILANIEEEFNGDGLSHEALYYEFANTLKIDVSDEFFRETAPIPYLQEYNLRHLNWLNQQDWQGKWAGFSAYERLDNIDYHHLELLVRSLGVTGRGLAFFKVHNKADHFDRTYDALVPIWQQQSDKVKDAFDFIGQHQLTMWQWLSDLLEAGQ